MHMHLTWKSMLAGLAWSAGAVAAGAPAASAQCKVIKLGELPVTMERGRPVISARINGSDVRLMLDSGAFWSSLSYAKAEELKLKLSLLPMGVTIRGVTGDAKAKLARVENFTLATWPIKNADFIVTSGPGNVAGLLGENILSQLDVEYDLPHGFVRFFHVEKCDDKSLAYWAAGKPSSTINLPRDTNTMGAKGLRESITAEVFVNGKRLKAIIDSGADTVLDLQAANSAGIDVKDPKVVSGGNIYGVGVSTRQSWIAPMASFKIGDEEVRNADVRIADLQDRTDMLLGSDFLISHRMFVSTSQKRIYFTYEGGAIFNSSPKWMVKDADGSLQASAATSDADPTDAAGFARRGSVRLTEQKLDLALADFTQAITLDPKTASYYHSRARVYLIRRQSALAMSDLDHAIALDATLVDALADRARLKLILADKPGAVADAALASQGSPKQGDLRLGLANIFSEAGKPERAIVEFTSWIDSHPDDARLPIALNGRCWARALANVDLDDGLKDCNRALSMRPKTPGFLDSRGLVQVRRRAFKEAVNDYGEVLKSQPKSGWALFGRSLAYRGLGQTAAADADRAAAIQNRPKIIEEAASFGIAG